MAFRRRVKFALAGIAAAASAMVAWACAGGSEAPAWALVKPSYDESGSAAMLLPSNDTRVNLYLLLADRRAAPMRDPRTPPDDVPLALFPWMIMSSDALPPHETEQDVYSGSRCQSAASGAAAFTAAVRAGSSIPEAEKQLLIAARQGLKTETKEIRQYLPPVECGAEPMSTDQLGSLRSAGGREFATYLEGAQDFYAGRFDAAAERFRALAGAADPWVRETSLYMVARTLVNLATVKSLTEYGDIEEPAKRDRAGAAAAGAAFEAYLAAYPQGRYAASARGLMRRVHWLGGDQDALGAEYAEQLQARTPLADAARAVALVNEVDQKLAFPTNTPGVARDPLLIAVVDLQRMRQQDDASLRESCCGPPITRAEIESQRPAFALDAELYDYIRAAEAFFVRNQPREVLQILPDAAHQPRFSYVQFSRQMLRGLALEAAGDRNTRGFWLSLLPGATQPYQRQALELAIATHDEKSGRLDLVFAPDSPVRHPVMRQLLIERVAGPDILRQQASRPGVPQIEREVALYTLLGKELQRGFYREFLSDVHLLRSEALAEGWFGGADYYDARFNSTLERPPVGKFGKAAKLGDFDCPALNRTISQLVENGRAIRPRLCLAEFFRDNDLDSFGRPYGDPPAHGDLTSTRPLFPTGTPYSRLTVYQAIINDPGATADDKALALNRAIRCYAPAGGNSCDRSEVPLAQRRAWFNRLKADYAQSRWARDLKYYW